ERDGLSRTLPARLGVVALDERTDDEPGPPDALGERLAFSLDLDPLPQATVTAPAFTKTDITAARRRLPQERLSPETEATLVAAAAACAIASLRAPILAVRAARALLALHSGALKEGDAAEIAARLVLAPRARALPAAEEDTPAEAPPDSPPEAPENAAKDSTETGPLPDRVLEAIRTALPAGLLRPSAPPRRSGDPGKAGHQRASPNRGRPIGSRPGTPDGRARLDLIATLRACAPWQPLRQRERSTTTLQVRTEDFRIRRHKRPSATATIFVVDASGSAAMARMAEAKGAIETLLAEAYVRRDEVALVAFRGTGAEVLLPPTRAPALARRRLAGLPGGGGTPLATGLETALTLAVRLRERGTAPILVVLTTDAPT
ncbi:MAG: VWA domain-containing protein, partial [Pseudomonadota bacterium]